MEWIKVKDRLPESGKRVLVTCNCGSKEAPYFIVTIGVCVNRNGKLEWSNELFEYDLLDDIVVAWMPLPKPLVDPYNIEQFETYDNSCWRVKR